MVLCQGETGRNGLTIRIIGVLSLGGAWLYGYRLREWTQ